MIKFIHVFLALAVLVGCKPSTTSPASSEDPIEADENTSASEEDQIYNVSGMFQKGPLIQGSAISIYELDNDLNASGASYITSILDDFGNYEFNDKIKSRFVSIEGEGYFQNELTGILSLSTIRMRALADLNSNETISVNLVTTLSIERAKYLVADGLSLVVALDQAFDEVLNAFNIEPLAEYDDINILGQTEASKIVLAISVISLQLASNDELLAGSFETALSHFMLRFNADLKLDGEIGSTFELVEKIRVASMAVSKEAVHTNIRAMMDYLGLTIDVPAFEEYVDIDGDGLLGKDDDNFDEDIALITISDVSPYTMASYKFSLANTSPDGFVLLGEPNLGAIYIDSVRQEAYPVVVVDGTELTVEVESGHWNESVSVMFALGDIYVIANVETRSSFDLLSEQNFFHNNVVYGYESSKFFAYPFLAPNDNLEVNYIGLGMENLYYEGGNLKSISIFSDESGVPSGKLFEAEDISFHGKWINSNDSFFYDGLDRDFFDPSIQGYFGPDGVLLSPGSPYWILIEFYESQSIKYHLATNDQTMFSEKKISTDGLNWSSWKPTPNWVDNSSSPGDGGIKLFIIH
jgi:hypothetical protein